MNKINTIKNYKILTIPIEESNIIYVQSFISFQKHSRSSTTALFSAVHTVYIQHSKLTAPTKVQT